MELAVDVMEELGDVDAEELNVVVGELVILDVTDVVAVDDIDVVCVDVCVSTSHIDGKRSCEYCSISWLSA